MTDPIPDGAYIEIVERVPKISLNKSPQLIVPNEVRINGTRLLTPANEPITIHKIDLKDRSVVQVTLTLFIRHLVIKQEPREET